ncbi:polysaccharide deacetylase family protein [Candidatus Roizmanbacteria bacterium]|nr:polysaccharide deacetylase family protein [Candidatus Roizmanbacteria bacterium]
MNEEWFRALPFGEQRRLFASGLLALPFWLKTTLNKEAEIAVPDFNCLITYSHQSIPTAMFEEILRAGFEPLTLREIVAHNRGEEIIPADINHVLFTFDDGFATQGVRLERYLQGLNSQRQTAGLKPVRPIVFVSLGFGQPQIPRLDLTRVDGNTPSFQDGSTNKYLTLTEILHLVRSNEVDIQSHGLTHSSLAAIPAQQARLEVVESRRRLDMVYGLVGVPHDLSVFAYPYGQISEQDLVAATYDLAFGTKETINSLLQTHRQRFNMPRVPDWSYLSNQTVRNFILTANQRQKEPDVGRPRFGWRRMW